jgi:hypothetical protein
MISKLFAFFLATLLKMSISERVFDNQDDVPECGKWQSALT